MTFKSLVHVFSFAIATRNRLIDYQPSPRSSAVQALLSMNKSSMRKGVDSRPHFEILTPRSIGSQMISVALSKTNSQGSSPDPSPEKARAAGAF